VRGVGRVGALLALPLIPLRRASRSEKSSRNRNAAVQDRQWPERHHQRPAEDFHDIGQNREQRHHQHRRDEARQDQEVDRVQSVRAASVLMHSCLGDPVDKARLATRKFMSSVEFSSRAEKAGN